MTSEPLEQNNTSAYSTVLVLFVLYESKGGKFSENSIRRLTYIPAFIPYPIAEPSWSAPRRSSITSPPLLNSLFSFHSLNRTLDSTVRTAQSSAFEFRLIAALGEGDDALMTPHLLCSFSSSALQFHPSAQIMLVRVHQLGSQEIADSISVKPLSSKHIMSLCMTNVAVSRFHFPIPRIYGYRSPRLQ